MWELREERGVPFVKGEAFYRAESCAGRDLAILAAALHRQRTGHLRVLDVMAGSGMRGARYLVQANADEVWVNDGSTALHEAMVYNMCTAAGLPLPPGSPNSATTTPSLVGPAARPVKAVTHDNGLLGPGTSSHTASTARQAQSEQALRHLTAYWEGHAEQLRLEGLARDVWQWDVPRPPDISNVELQPALPPPLPLAAVAAPSSATGDVDRDACGGDHGNGRGATGSGEGTQPSASSRGAACRAGTTDCDINISSRSSSSSSVAGGVVTEGCSVGSDVTPAGVARVEETTSGRRIRISHADANRLLTNCYMRESYYDLIDVDSFGSETMHFPAAVDAVRYGGLLYLTSTDGFTTSGKRPARGLAAYGSYARAMPWANEQGLRMIIGAAVREAAARGVTLAPVFSLYSYHGPVFRVMLRATRSADWPAHHYGFVGHCFVHGDNYTVGWRSLSSATCRCEARGRPRPTHGPSSAAPDPGDDPAASIQVIATANAIPGASSRRSARGGRRRGGQAGDQQQVDVGQLDDAGCEDQGCGHVSGSRTPLVLAGPMWTGPLHDEAELRAMAAEAARRGWTGFGLDAAAAPHLQSRVKSSRNVRPLEELLAVLLEEADPRLPAGFFSIDDSVARRLARPPPRDGIIAALREEGFAAARCHLEARAFRTNACMEDIVRVAEEQLGIPRRARL